MKGLCLVLLFCVASAVFAETAVSIKSKRPLEEFENYVKEKDFSFKDDIMSIMELIKAKQVERQLRKMCWKFSTLCNSLEQIQVHASTEEKSAAKQILAEYLTRL